MFSTIDSDAILNTSFLIIANFYQFCLFISFIFILTVVLSISFIMFYYAALNLQQFLWNYFKFLMDKYGGQMCLKGRDERKRTE